MTRRVPCRRMDLRICSSTNSRSVSNSGEARHLAPPAILMPMDAQSGYAQVSYGSYNFERATLAVTGPISAANHIDYSLAASYQDTGAAVGYYNEQHYFIAPQLSWRPTPTTLLVADVEYSKQWINGNGFQAFRGVSSTSAALPTNNDQFEAVGFYYPPGSDPNSYNV